MEFSLFLLVACLSFACVIGHREVKATGRVVLVHHQKSPISTHILDTSRGRPADGVLVSLEFQDPNDGNFGKSNFVAVGSGLTDADGRCNHLMSAANNLRVGIYRLTFQTGAYFARLNQDTFFPSVDLVFEVKNLDEQYHVPLLLSAYGYSTYRGS